jgi:uncharacterized protein YjhX (UPF0386 family)
MPPQSPRDRILWTLANSGGKMERSRLRRCAGMKLADLDPILAELARGGKIRISREMISIIYRIFIILNTQQLCCVGAPPPFHFKF